MIAHEINSPPIEYENLPSHVRKKLELRKCENCEKPLDKKSIDYVLTSKGAVVWWHRESNLCKNYNYK